MDIGTIYAEATGKREPKSSLPPTPKEEPVNQADVEASKQLHLQTKLDWIQSVRTQEIFNELKQQIASLEDDARKLAVNYHNHQNHLLIIKNLTESEQLRQFLIKYGHAE